MKCPNSETNCGAGWRNSVYDVTGGNGAAVEEKPVKKAVVKAENYVGCFEDKSQRTLPVNLNLGKGQSLEACVDAAKAKGLKYAGLQYSVECWGGNDLPPNKKDDKECNMKCPNS